MTDMHLVNGIWLPASDNGVWLAKQPVVDGVARYQYDRIEACVEICRQQGRLGLAIDGGAHVGLWSMHLASHFASVAAFEPVPANFECLERNLAGRHNVAKHQLALSMSSGHVFMSPRVSDDQSVKSISWRVTMEPSGLQFITPCVSIDSLNLGHLDLLKLDVEGAELPTLLGANATIMRCKPMVIIEDKHGGQKRAVKHLHEIGMTLHININHDYLFLWEKP